MDLVTHLYQYLISKHNTYECHIDYFWKDENLNEHHSRLQQVAVAKKDILSSYEFFVTFCWPNIAVESTFFDIGKERLIQPLSALSEKGYPVHFNQYIGFISINSHIAIEDISIKEVFL